jgi:parallel beta-helix repeat protein
MMHRSASVQRVARAAFRLSLRGRGALSSSLLALAVAGCRGDDSSTPLPSPDASAEAAITSDASDGGNCAFTVDPSSDDRAAIQEALIDAQSGDTVCLGHGVFHVNGQLSLATANVTVRGKDDTVLDFSDQASGANGLEITANNDTVDTVAIQNTKGDGLRATQVDFVTIRNVHVAWTAGPSTSNGGYGIYPVTSSHVLIENCSASGASDTGIYVGQSNTIVIRNNDVSGNVAGIEVENSTDAEVYGNHSHGNSGGILLFNLPGLDVKDGKRANVHDNIVEDNNLANFAPEGNIVHQVPNGTGMFILASDENEVHGNTIRNNQSFGVAVLSWFILSRDMEGQADAQFDFYPERNNVHDNTVSGNGQSPQNQAMLISSILGLTTLSDIDWDGIIDTSKLAVDGGASEGGALDDADNGSPPAGFDAIENCFRNNGDGTFLNLDFGNFGAHKSFDVTPYGCDRPALPAISFAGVQ